MPRQYFSVLLLGIVTISAVCLGLRWHTLAQMPEQTHPPVVSAVPAEDGLATPVAPPSQSHGSRPEDREPSEAPNKGLGLEVASKELPPGEASTPPVGNSASTAVQGLLTPDRPSQTKPGGTPAQQYPEKPQPVRVDINRATVEQLQALPGIGPTLAQRIVDYRKLHGPFKSLSELNNVKGIGEKKLADIKPWAYVGK